MFIVILVFFVANWFIVQVLIHTQYLITFEQ
jgi:hypothetical protein